MQALGFGQEPIILFEGSWSAGLFPYVDYLGCPLLYSTFLQPDGIAEFWLFFCAWVLLSFLTLPASTLLSTMTLLVVMDWLIGPLRRDGLSSPGSPQAAFLPRDLLQGFGAGKLVSSFLWIPAALYALLGSSEGVFIVLNCTLALVWFSARALLVTSDSFNFSGLAQSNLGSSALPALRLYAQDPGVPLFSLSLCASLALWCCFKERWRFQ